MTTLTSPEVIAGVQVAVAASGAFAPALEAGYAALVAAEAMASELEGVPRALDKLFGLGKIDGDPDFVDVLNSHGWTLMSGADNLKQAVIETIAVKTARALPPPQWPEAVKRYPGNETDKNKLAQALGVRREDSTVNPAIILFYSTKPGVGLSSVETMIESVRRAQRMETAKMDSTDAAANSHNATWTRNAINASGHAIDDGGTQLPNVPDIGFTAQIIADLPGGVAVVGGGDKLSTLVKAIAQVGDIVINGSKVLTSGHGAIRPDTAYGYAVGLGLMSTKLDDHKFNGVRDKLSPADQVGFDTAVATAIARVAGGVPMPPGLKKPIQIVLPPKGGHASIGPGVGAFDTSTMQGLTNWAPSSYDIDLTQWQTPSAHAVNSTQQAGALAASGLAGASENTKAGVLGNLSGHDDLSTGANNAIDHIGAQTEHAKLNIIQKILKFLHLYHPAA